MRIVDLKDCVDLINGHAFKKGDWSNDGKKIIRIQNLTEGDSSFNRTIKDVDRKFIIRKGDILISWAATLGVYEWTEEEALLNQHIYKVVFKTNEINKSYFKYALEEAIEELKSKMKGSTMKHLSKKNLENYQFALPELIYQNRIVKILDKINLLIETRKRTIELSETMLKAKFDDMFGNPLKNKHNYEVVTLKEITTHIKDGPHTSPKYSAKGIPILSSRNVKPGKLILDDVKYVSISMFNTITKYFKPQFGDVLLTKGGTTGYAKRVDFNWDFCVWVHLAVLRLKNNCNSTYVESALNSDFCYFQSQKLTKGIANKDLGIRRIERIKLLLPPLDVQEQYEKIYSVLQEINLKRNKAKSELELLFKAVRNASLKGELPESDKLQKLLKDTLSRQILIEQIKSHDFETSKQYDSAKKLLFQLLDLENSTIIQEYTQNSKKIQIKMRDEIN